MNKEKLLGELDKRFAELKKKRDFKTNLEDLDKAFFVKDRILQEGYVSDNLGRQISSIIAKAYANWNTYLHGLIFPNPSNLINLAESKIFNETERNKMNKMISKAMSLVSKSTLINLDERELNGGKFFDESLMFWNESYEPKMKEIVKKIEKNWLKGR